VLSRLMYGYRRTDPVPVEQESRAAQDLRETRVSCRLYVWLGVDGGSARHHPLVPRWQGDDTGGNRQGEDHSGPAPSCARERGEEKRDGEQEVDESAGLIDP
jgi:hypothetical protein